MCVCFVCDMQCLTHSHMQVVTRLCVCQAVNYGYELGTSQLGSDGVVGNYEVQVLLTVLTFFLSRVNFLWSSYYPDDISSVAS